jgi:parallel beta-helix repeat protein
LGLGLASASLALGRVQADPAPPPSLWVPGLAAPKLAAGATQPGPTLNVKSAPFLARGDGTGDDTPAIQRAIDAVAGTGGTLVIPDGTYLVNPVAHEGRAGLVLGGRMTLRMAPGAVLKALPCASETYAILSASGLSDLSITGGTLVGERDRHQGDTGEWGMGLQLMDAVRVSVRQVTARECWGDGFYIGGASRAITLGGLTAEHNRRQGLSITGGESILVRDSAFNGTVGTEPQSGIDIEPNRGDTVRNVLITGCTLRGNAGDGIQCGVPEKHTGEATVAGVRIDRNQALGNGFGRTGNGIRITNHHGTQVTNNQVKDNQGLGILLAGGADDTLCSGNTVTGTRGKPGNGILEYDCSGNTIVGNTVTGSSGKGIVSQQCADSTIRDNLERGNGSWF